MKVEAHDKFEYTYETFSGFSMSKVLEKLNILGEEGWELIAIIKDDLSRNRYIFKRKVTSINV